MEEKKALKKRLGQKKEPPEAFMASFFASVEIYQTKMLVRYFPKNKNTTMSLSTVREFKSICCLSRTYTLMFYLQNYLARNFYNLRFLALFVAFAINFILLFYKVSSQLSKHNSCCI